jgi:predicted ABC-type ATPase
LTPRVPRLRIFAGPNGSGKSTIKDLLPSEWLGAYVNADEIEKSLRQGFLELSGFGIETTEEEIQKFLADSKFLTVQRLAGSTSGWTFVDGRLEAHGSEVNSYHASVLADFLRRKLLAARASFTFETVMSSRDKVDFLAEARRSGFRTYLYFVATEDPAINIDRVRQRVATGGHPVPEDKIVSRYARSLGLLLDAVAASDRAYLFDNSGHEKIWIAEASDGVELQMKCDSMPGWFKSALWDKFIDAN